MAILWQYTCTECGKPLQARGMLPDDADRVECPACWQKRVDADAAQFNKGDRVKPKDGSHGPGTILDKIPGGHLWIKWDGDTVEARILLKSMCSQLEPA